METAPHNWRKVDTARIGRRLLDESHLRRFNLLSSSFAVNTVLADRLKDLRHRANLSQAELAQLLGTSLVAIAQWERSTTFPSKRQEWKIAEILAKARCRRFLK